MSWFSALGVEHIPFYPRCSLRLGGERSRPRREPGEDAMTRYRQQDTPRTVAEMLENLTVPQLKPLVQLLDRNPPPRKGEMISVLTHFLLRPERLQRLYNELDPISQAAVQEATHDPEGALAHDEFVAKFGQAPLFSKASNRDEWDYDSDRRPTPLRLFFLDPYHNLLPTDLRELLLTFVRS